MEKNGKLGVLTCMKATEAHLYQQTLCIVKTKEGFFREFISTMEVKYGSEICECEIEKIQKKILFHIPMPERARCIITLMCTLTYIKIDGDWSTFGKEKRICDLCCLNIPETEERVHLECITFESVINDFQEFAQDFTSFQEL